MPPPPNNRLNHKRRKGFTLAELLIALAILGVIATFSIPKVLQGQQDATQKSITKESVGMISAAYQQYSLNTPPTGSTKITALTPFLNYVKYDTGSTIDNDYTLNTQTCNNTSQPCFRMHNGSVVMLVHATNSFGGTASTNVWLFSIDPDGKVTDGTTNGPGKAVTFALYFNGRMSTYADLAAGSADSGSSLSACPACMPPWFNWN